MKLYAHITKVAGGYRLRITDQIRPIGGSVFAVKGKRDARKLAAMHDAQPWNF